MKSLFYILTFILSAAALGYLFYYQFRPQIVERGCAEIAVQSSDFLFKGRAPANSDYDYESVKQRCLNDSLDK